MKFFNYYLVLSVALAAFVVQADLGDQGLPVETTTPPPSIVVTGGSYDDDNDNLDNETDVVTLPLPAEVKIYDSKKKQQDLAKADAKHNKNRRSNLKLNAKHMVCSVVTGTLVCYSIDQNDVTFESSECVVAPDGDKAYTICSRSLV